MPLANYLGGDMMTKRHTALLDTLGFLLKLHVTVDAKPNNRQAAFRGYRLRERLRRLPAREAEKQIKALHRNARGFRRVGLFLVFAGLYFALVFYGVDISFQRSVQQSLKDHLALVSRPRLWRLGWC